MNFCICRESNKCVDYPKDLGCLWKMLPSLNGAISGRIIKMEGVEVTIDPTHASAAAR
jgi:hypothetical protein